MSKKLPDVLFGIDTETSGLDPKDGAQCLSIGLITVKNDADLTELDRLYLEIRFEPSRYTWSAVSEGIHGLSQSYLANNGLPMFSAALDIKNFIESFLREDEKIVLIGHNPAFDNKFFQQVCAAIGWEPPVSYRMVDTFSIGFGAMGLQNSNEIFDCVGQTRNAHNAMEDIEICMEFVRQVRRLVKNARTC